MSPFRDGGIECCVNKLSAATAGTTFVTGVARNGSSAPALYSMPICFCNELVTLRTETHEVQSQEPARSSRSQKTYVSAMSATMMGRGERYRVGMSVRSVAAGCHFSSWNAGIACCEPVRGAGTIAFDQKAIGLGNESSKHEG